MFYILIYYTAVILFFVATSIALHTKVPITTFDNTAGSTTVVKSTAKGAGKPTIKSADVKNATPLTKVATPIIITDFAISLFINSIALKCLIFLLLRNQKSNRISLLHHIFSDSIHSRNNSTFHNHRRCRKKIRKAILF